MGVTLDITERYTVWRTYRVTVDAPASCEDAAFKEWFYDEWCFENAPADCGVLVRAEEEYEDMSYEPAEEDDA